MSAAPVDGSGMSYSYSRNGKQISVDLESSAPFPSGEQFSGFPGFPKRIKTKQVRLQPIHKSRFRVKVISSKSSFCGREGVAVAKATSCGKVSSFSVKFEGHDWFHFAASELRFI